MIGIVANDIFSSFFNSFPSEHFTSLFTAAEYQAYVKSILHNDFKISFMSGNS